MDVESIMTKNVVSAKATDDVRSALTLLEDQEIRHLPVLDEARLVGMVSDRDLREYRLPLMEELEDPDYADDLLKTPLVQVMNGNVVSVHPTEGLGAAVDVMLEYGVGAVPVVDRHTDEMVGIISYVDLLRALRSSL